MYGIFYLHVVDFDGFHVGKINLPYMDAMGFKMISSFQTRGVNFVSLKITRFFLFRRFEREMWVAKNGSLVYWSKKEAVILGGQLCLKDVGNADERVSTKIMKKCIAYLCLSTLRWDFFWFSTRRCDWYSFILFHRLRGLPREQWKPLCISVFWEDPNYRYVYDTYISGVYPGTLVA